ESAVHQMRGRAWKKALRSGRSKVYALRRITVDLDSTVKTVFGHQEGAEKGYNTAKKGAKSYHPQLAFCAETKEVLQGWQRTGNAYTANGAVEFMKQLLASLPAHMKIIFRADSGYFGGALLSYLEACGHCYLIKVSMRNLAKLLIKQNWKSIESHPGWECCEFQHQCGNWEKPRRFVAVRQRSQPKPKKQQRDLLGQVPEYDYFCYVTSESLTPWAIHKAYGKRATCETWIEECKNQMALGHIKTDDFMANSALMQCSILAYNAVRWMGLISGSQQLIKWEPESVRSYIIRIGGHLLTGGKQLKIATDTGHLYQQEWDAWLAIGDCA
ncbi:MAG: IS1380 family transposase, partial [Gammaproteobacteria bacterium]|nr:IS1380 family transposase [Gammaproteobacteria bacterium]